MATVILRQTILHCPILPYTLQDVYNPYTLHTKCPTVALNPVWTTLKKKKKATDFRRGGGAVEGGSITANEN